MSFWARQHEDEEGERRRSQADPVVGTSGTTDVKAGRRIDRIDQIGDATFESLTTRRGRYYAPPGRPSLQGGSRLQHALYAWPPCSAQAQVQRAKSPAEPTISRALGRQGASLDRNTSQAALAAVLADCGTSSPQNVHHAADEEACMFCDFATACGASDALGRVEAKLQDRLLAARRRLQTHD